ncbi:MAG: tRNA-dihydrouridine synthase family protein [Phycisphaerales bacterium]|jgi:nifR3 family TIM-barrel protein|nr:tRNA-dihydrouridine synthase family protein [Phycisphaerales bacterium]
MIGVPLQVGPVTLETNLLLAPIAGWCDLAWRVTARSLGGVGLACTDLLSPAGLICGSEASKDLARTNDLDKPIGMQLYGSDPRVLADGARWCVDHGATLVDINMGCPVDKVTKKDGGSKLMCDVDRAARIAGEVRRALPDHVPLTCKMRLGWDETAYEDGCAPRLAVMLAREGAAGITVHGRTTEMRFRGQCRREGIRRVVEAVADATGVYDPTIPHQSGRRVPVIGNGDVRTPDDALSMLRETGCAGVMIGRGAFAMPWIFRASWAAQLEALDRAQNANATLDTFAARCGVTDSFEPTEEQKLDLVLAYFARLREYKDDRAAMHTIRLKISWLGKTINGSHCKELKDAVRGARTPDEVIAAVEAWRELVRAGRTPARGTVADHAEDEPAGV